MRSGPSSRLLQLLQHLTLFARLLCGCRRMQRAEDKCSDIVQGIPVGKWIEVDGLRLWAPLLNLAQDGQAALRASPDAEIQGSKPRVGKGTKSKSKENVTQPVTPNPKIKPEASDSSLSELSEVEFTMICTNLLKGKEH